MDRYYKEIVNFDHVDQEGWVEYLSSLHLQFRGVACRSLPANWRTVNHFWVKRRIPGAGVIIVGWDLQNSARTVRRPIVHYSTMVAKMFAD